MKNYQACWTACQKTGGLITSCSITGLVKHSSPMRPVLLLLDGKFISHQRLFRHWRNKESSDGPPPHTTHQGEPLDVSFLKSLVKCLYGCMSEDFGHVVTKFPFFSQSMVHGCQAWNHDELISESSGASIEPSGNYITIIVSTFLTREFFCRVHSAVLNLRCTTESLHSYNPIG